MRSQSILSSSAQRGLESKDAPDVLAALRDATTERHRIVDRVLPLAGPHPTQDDYFEHLRLMRAWLSPLERWLGSGTRDTARVEADLAHAGIPFDPEPDCLGKISWRADASAPYRWGARYVIEGSRLGAAALYRRLRFTLRADNLRYLRGEGSASADRWARFLRELRAAVQNPADIAEACRGAGDAFDALLEVHRLRSSNAQRVGKKV